MTMLLTIQYLEDNPDLASFSPRTAAEELRRAFDILPITHVLIGWRLPPLLLEACQRETALRGAKFLRWHPLLTGDGSFIPHPDWQVTGLDGEKVAGFQNMPEFTFVCPNHPQASWAALQHLEQVAQSGIYQGLFLDRVRFPSPAAGPLRHLGCFCPHCRQAAAEQGLDLNLVQALVRPMAENPRHRAALVWGLLGGRQTGAQQAGPAALQRLLDFRAHSITRFVRQAVGVVKAAGLEAGLDCFSPGLARMVGQDLAALGAAADWIKIMTYAHTRGPAGLPYELLGLVDFLAAASPRASHARDSLEAGALELISQALGQALPGSCRQLAGEGLPAEFLAEEIAGGVRRAPCAVLAGIELVEIAGVAQLDEAQIRRDLKAARAARPAGLSISWDLRYISPERLELARQAWCGS